MTTRLRDLRIRSPDGGGTSAAPASRSPAYRHKQAIAAAQAGVAESQIPNPHTPDSPTALALADAEPAGSSDSSNGGSFDKRRGSEAMAQTLTREDSFYKRRTSDRFRETRSARMVALPASMTAATPHAVLGRHAGFKLQHDAAAAAGERAPQQEPDVEAVDRSETTLARADSFRKRRTSDNFRATRSSRIVALPAAMDEHAHGVLGSEGNFRSGSPFRNVEATG
eukprot:Transcript_14920.p1 GENE.Transcript_14920~~Transcript_14920.p1  ORF type:complete len:225 (-),score=22.36 Transcript_14920:80-754(-)